jgi:hypothetical protein
MSENFTERVRWANEEIINKGNLNIVRELFAEDYSLARRWRGLPRSHVYRGTHHGVDRSVS